MSSHNIFIFNILDITIAETLAWCKVKGEIKFPLHVAKKIYSLSLLQPELLLFQKKKKFAQ